MKRFGFFMYIFFWFFCLIFGVVFLFVMINVKSFLVYESAIIPKAVDAIVVLGGGGGNRVQKAVELSRYVQSRFMIMTGSPYYYLSEPQIMANYAIKLGFNHHDLLLEEYSFSTKNHIKNLIPIFDKNQIKSVIVVTSLFHTKRSYDYFRYYCDEHDVSIHFSMVGADDGVDYSRWWRDHEMKQTIWMEFQKMVYYFLFK